MDSTLFSEPGRDEFFDQITQLPTTMVEEFSLCVEVRFFADVAGEFYKIRVRALPYRLRRRPAASLVSLWPSRCRVKISLNADGRTVRRLAI